MTSGGGFTFGVASAATTSSTSNIFAQPLFSLGSSQPSTSTEKETKETPGFTFGVLSVATPSSTSNTAPFRLGETATPSIQPSTSTEKETKETPGFTFGHATGSSLLQPVRNSSGTVLPNPVDKPLLQSPPVAMSEATEVTSLHEEIKTNKSKSKTKIANGTFLFPRIGTSSLLEVPWRKVEWTEEEKKSLLERLSSYSPSSSDVPQARVLLLGPVGSGKSSFISSIQSVLDGRVTTRAMVGRGGSSSFTKKLQSFPLSSPDGSSTLVLCDMAGFGDGTLTGPTLHHMLSVIKGHAPEGYKFRPEQVLSSDTEGYVKRPGLRERVHCVAFVLDASKVLIGSYSERIRDTFQTLRDFISDMGVHQVVLLTHIDKICQSTAEDTSEVYRSVCVRDTMYKAAELVGVSPSSVVPVRNYWCELEPELSSDVLLLRALDHILLHTELLLREEHGSRQSRSSAEGK